MKQKTKQAPRNPLVAPAKFRKAGAHGKSAKAVRRAEKIQLQGEYGVAATRPLRKVLGQGSSPCAPTITPFAWPLTQWPAEWWFATRISRIGLIGKSPGLGPGGSPFESEVRDQKASGN